ncbi:MAG: hypothetical protein ACKO5K_03090 [Armatimonadota bacterium]
MSPLRRIGIAVLALAGLPLAPRAIPSQPPTPLVPVATVAHGPVSEISGIVASRRFPGTYWVHNDSGDRARIFAMDAKGTVLMPPFLKGGYRIGADDSKDPKPQWPGLPVDGATNYDWEDIATDGDHLFIADTGNNGNARRDLAVYVLSEPNPLAVESAHVLRRIPVAYPDQKGFPDPADWTFDCEAMFVHKGRLHFLTKHRAPGKIGIPQNGTKLYRLEGEHTDRVNVLRKLDAVPDLGGWITAADVSPDGRTLAVLCHAPVASVWLFDLGKSGDRLLSGPSKRFLLRGAGQCEAVCFDGDSEVIVANEERQLFRIGVDRFVAEAPRRP